MFPYFCTFICHHPKPRTWCLVSSAERAALNFSVNAYGDLSSSKHVIVVTVCFAATDIYSSFTIFTPHRYSLRFIRILTVTLSVTHKYSTIITCLGVPTTLYPHYCRHASTQDCGSGKIRTCDQRIKFLWWVSTPLQHYSEEIFVSVNNSVSVRCATAAPHSQNKPLLQFHGKQNQLTIWQTSTDWRCENLKLRFLNPCTGIRLSPLSLQPPLSIIIFPRRTLLYFNPKLTLWEWL